MKYLFVVLFILVYAFFDTNIGYTHTSPMYTHLTYMFMHANAIHLALNSLAFLSMFRVLERVISKPTLILSVIFIAFTMSFLSAHSIPTVGASGMVYAMVGIFSGLIATRDIRVIDNKKIAIFYLAIFLSLSISFFRENSNFLLHLYSLLFGFSAAWWLNKIKHLTART